MAPVLHRRILFAVLRPAHHFVWQAGKETGLLQGLKVGGMFGYGNFRN